MSGMHLTRELLLAVLRRERNPGDVAAVFIAHLETLCPKCHQEMAAFRAETFPPQVTFHDFGRRQRRIEEWHQVLPDADALPVEEQQELEDALLEAPDRAQALLRAQELLEKTRARLPAQPAEALTHARQAKAVLRRHPATPETIQCYALALAHEGNAHRAEGELRQAVDCFAAARFLLRSHGGGARRVTAEVDQLEGSLCRGQRRLEEATVLLHRAYVAFVLEEDWVRALRVLLKLGLVHREAGELTAAVATARQAVSALDGAEEQRLSLMAYHNLAYFLADAGDYTEAREALATAERLARFFPDRWTQLRLLWVEGNIARGLGETREAEAAYQAVRHGFLQQGVGYDAALVSLDLAVLYAQQGETAEVKRLASEMLPVFQAQDVHREALAALLLFQQAAHAERVTVAFLESLILYLEAARHNPELPFREN